MENKPGPYDDILYLPHPTSAKHPRMPLADRAAQFSAFRALSGHEDAIGETERLTDRRIELSEEMKAELAKRVNQAVIDALGCPAEAITLSIEDVQPENWQQVIDTQITPNMDKMYIVSGKAQK